MATRQNSTSDANDRQNHLPGHLLSTLQLRSQPSGKKASLETDFSSAPGNNKSAHVPKYGSHQFGTSHEVATLFISAYSPLILVMKAPEQYLIYNLRRKF